MYFIWSPSGTTKHQASPGASIKASMNENTTNNNKNVLVFPVLSHSYNAAWIQRLEEFGWN